MENPLADRQTWVAMSNSRYQSIENIRFLAFVNYKIEDLIFGHFYFTLFLNNRFILLHKNVFSIKQDCFNSKKNVFA